MTDTVETKPAPTGTVAYDASSALVLAGRARRMFEMTQDCVIESDAMMEAFGSDLRDVKALQKKVEEQRTSITGPLNAALKAVNDLFRPAKEYLEQAEKSIKDAMNRRIAYVEQVAREEQARAAERERVERERIAAEQREQERIAAEAAQREAAAKAEAEAAAARGDETARQQAEQRAQAEAIAAQEATENAAAAAVQSEVISVPSAAPAPVKVAGVSSSKALDFEVNDMQALIKYVAAHPELSNLLIVDSVKMRNYVRLVGLESKLEGVRVFEKRTIAARSK